MSKNTKHEPQPNEVVYAVHNDSTPHLHSYRTVAEAEEEIANDPAMGKTIYTAGEVLFALEEQPRLRLVGYVAATIVASAPDSVAGKLLAPPIQALAKGVIDAFRAGKLTSAVSKEALADLATQVAALDSLESEESEVSAIFDRKVRIVASRPETGQTGIEALIGREFGIEGYNPVTQQVQISVSGNGQPAALLVLSPDEYVFADELTANSTK